MDDGPRTEAVAELLARADGPYRPGQTWRHYLDRAGELLAAADPVDPLRALLANEDRWLEFVAKARFEATGRDGWDAAPKRQRQDWIAATRATFATELLAALREVAGL